MSGSKFHVRTDHLGWRSDCARDSQIRDRISIGRGCTGLTFRREVYWSRNVTGKPHGKKKEAKADGEDYRRSLRCLG